MITSFMAAKIGNVLAIRKKKVGKLLKGENLHSLRHQIFPPNQAEDGDFTNPLGIQYAQQICRPYAGKRMARRL